jgi:pimeloyl-ACP methyl ester carboxylesterase
VITLTLIGSEPHGWDGEALPNITPVFLDHFAGLEQLDCSSDDQVRAFLFKIEQLCAGSGRPFDAGRALARVNAVMARSPRLASAFNHGAAQLRGDWSGRFRGITQPTLVIHGEDDPILPVQNGKALASGIRGARLVTLAGVGHELPRQSLPVIVDEITSLSKLVAP